MPENLVAACASCNRAKNHAPLLPETEKELLALLAAQPIRKRTRAKARSAV